MSFVLPGVVNIPAGNSFEQGALLEPTNTVLKGVRRLRLLENDTVLVVGQGPIGLMFTRILSLEGIKVVAVDFLESRLKLAREFGAKWCVKPEEIFTIVKRTRNGFDAAIIAVPSDASVASSLQVIRSGGQCLLFAHTARGASTPVDLSSVCVDEKDVIGSYSADFTLQAEVTRMVFSGSLGFERLISHRFGIVHAVRAIELTSKPSEQSLKVVIANDPERR